jgi:hypothetical protein
VRITGKEYLLILRSSGHFKKVEIAPMLGEALLNWNGRDRLSPIYEIEIEGVRDQSRLSRGQGFMIFVGPLKPTFIDGILPLLRRKNDHAWLTFGLFNCVIYTAAEKEAKAVIAWAKKHGIRWEQWNLNGDLIAGVKHSRAECERPKSLLSSLASLNLTNPLQELRDASEEYRALLATAACRSSETHPDIVHELERANSILVEAALSGLNAKRTPRALAATAVLVDANAALSRFSSQMYSGISPIFETECHFWTHSLLGTGVANLALVKIRRFITNKLGEARIPEQIALLEYVANPELVKEVLEDGQIWDSPWLQKLPSVMRREPLLSERSPFRL